MERNLGMPSGCEVESATLHVPVNEELVVMHTPVSTGMRGRLDALKSRGMAKLRDVRHDLDHRRHAMQRTLADRQVQMKSQVQSSMSTNPMKWAGIAAGSGFVLGMIGRIIHHRSKHRPTLDIVVIDAMC